ncbi:MAG: MBL fold metallo-hydrolase [Clostridia bacterium]|nr:MBL fold metallo-hydrolase [Clostridia bacterium]
MTDDNSFVIKSFGHAIAINAKNSKALIAAIEHFRKLALDNEFIFKNELEYVSEPLTEIVLAADGASEYKIVHLAGLDTSLKGGNEKYDLEVKLGYDLQEAIKTKVKETLPVVNDGAEYEYEILIGETSRQESIDFRNSLALSEYGYEIIGNKIVISGTNHTTTHLAVSLFIESVNSFTEISGNNASLVLYDGMRITTRAAGWNTNIPEFEGGSFGGTLDSGQGSLTVLYKDTTAEAFADYCDKLESLGYERWQKNTIEDNVHATYTHSENGMIHVYYAANEQNVRIVSYKKGKYNLPTSTEKESYEAITQTSITQYGLDRKNGAVGMCYVITLEDGSFIVVDSGTENDDKSAYIEFYNLLKHLNKRPDGQIVIRAWYLTHEHSDHYQMFAKFMQEYGKKVTIQEFWCNTSTKDFTYNGANGNITWEKSYSKYANYVNGDFKWINLHTGMEFYAGNMKFEVLYTEEDLFPKVCRSYNNCILIMKMTDTTSGQTMLWMGDLLLDGCETLAARYDGYLKSDLLQVAHHGKSEAVSIYKEVLPKVAFWSCTTAQKNTLTNNATYRETNQFLAKNVLVHICSDYTYTIKLPYASGDKIEKWIP